MRLEFYRVSPPAVRIRALPTCGGDATLKLKWRRRLCSFRNRHLPLFISKFSSYEITKSRGVSRGVRCRMLTFHPGTD
jgi:hypothetical protein